MSEWHQVWPDPLAGPLVPTCEGHMGLDSLALILEGNRCLLVINLCVSVLQKGGE